MRVASKKEQVDTDDIMKLSWKRCLTCATKLDRVGFDERERDEDTVGIAEKNIVIKRRTRFLSFLIGSHSTATSESNESSSSNDILNYIVSTLSTEPASRIRFCDECEKRSELVTSLLLELEATQMKIMDVLQTVKLICRWIDEKEGFRGEVSEFEKRLINQNKLDDNANQNYLKQVQTFIKTLSEVQHRIVNSEIKPNSIFSPYFPPTVALKRVKTMQNSKREVKDKHSVKQEPEYELYDETLFDADDFHFDQCESHISDEEEKADECNSLLQRRLGGKRKLNTTRTLAERFKVQNKRLKNNTNDVVSSTNTSVSTTTEGIEGNDSILSPSESSELLGVDSNQARIQNRHRNKNQPKLSSFRSKLGKRKAPDPRKRSFDKLIDEGPTAIEQQLLQVKASYPEIACLLNSGDSFTCHTCNFQTYNSSIFDHHLREHETNSQPFQCPEDTCSRPFSTPQYFMFHLQQHCVRKRRCIICKINLPVLQMEEHLKTHFEQLYSCESCDYSYGSFLDLLDHCRRHSGIRMKCQLCTDPELTSKLYTPRIELRQHVYEYHKMEEVLLKCSFPDCSKTFFDEVAKNQHVKRHQLNFACSSCPKTFKNRINLINHVRKLHKVNPETKNGLQQESHRSQAEQQLLNIKADLSFNKIFKCLHGNHLLCLECGFKTDKGYVLDCHLRQHETKKKNFSCPEIGCKRSFTTKQHFVFHLQQHCSRSRKCSLCDKTLPVLQMGVHLKTHYDRLFSCEWCDFSFGSFPDLIHHTRFHPRAKMKCQLCTNPKSYSSRNELRKHLYQQHNMEELLLKCKYPDCSEMFFDPYRLSAHANIHLKNFICEVCSTEFTKKSDLRTHLVCMHKNKKHLLDKVSISFRKTSKSSTAVVSVSLMSKMEQLSESEKLLRKLEAEESSKELFDSFGPTHNVCVMCKFKGQKVSLIDQHLRKHETEEKNFHCPEKPCNSSFTNKQRFVLHLQNHCRRKRKCTECSVMLPVLEMMKHLELHFKRVFACGLCDFCYGNYKDLLHHYASHAKADLPCDLCVGSDVVWQRYPTRHLLYQHVYKDHQMDDLLTRCDHPNCTETFLDLNQKTIHMSKSHHSSVEVKIVNSHKRKNAGISKTTEDTSRTRTSVQNSSSVVIKTTAAEKSLLELEANESLHLIFKALRSESFTCVRCQFRTTRSFVFDQHLREHENSESMNKSFSCPQPNCTKIFFHEQSFIFHLQQHSRRKRKCDLCKESLPVLALEEHLRTHSNEIYSCLLCDFSFGCFQDFILHGRYHTKADRKCQLCTDPNLKSQTYPTFPSLLRHLYDHHKKEEVLLKCSDPDCSETFFDVRLKKLHDDQHKGIFKCKHCQRSFPTQATLSSHIKVHENEKSMLCDKCPEGFRTKLLLNAHKIKMHGMQPYCCELCPASTQKEFATASGLKLHVKVHHKQIRWKCSICDQVLMTKASLIRHEQTHSTVKRFQCDACGYATSVLASLKKHKKLHGEKKFVCSYCNKSFTIKRYLDEHIFTHTKEQPFVCDVCGSRFNQRYSLTFHKKKKHGHGGNNGEANTTDGEAEKVSKESDDDGC